MAISHVNAGDSGATNRAKINAAIDKANLVDGKANQSSLASEISARQSGDNNLQAQINLRATTAQLGAETAARQQADQAETQARQQAVQAEATARQQADQAETAARIAGDDIRTRYAEIASAGLPGMAPRFFTTELTGAPLALPDWPEGAVIRTQQDGAAAVLDGAHTIAPKAAFIPEPGRRYRARFAFRRVLDTKDPSNDAVRIGVQWLDKDFASIAGSREVTVFANVVDMLVANGRQQYEFRFGRDVGETEDIDFEVPANAVFGRLFLRTFGNGRTHVDLLSLADITDAVSWSPDVSGMRREIDSLAYGLSLVGDRFFALETNVEDSRDAGWFVRGTLDEARLSDNVMLRHVTKEIIAEQIWVAAQRYRSAIYVGDNEVLNGANPKTPTARIFAEGDHFAIAPTNKTGGFNTLREFTFSHALDVWLAEGGFRTTGTVTATLDGSIGRDLAVGRHCTITGDATIGGTLGVTGAVAFASTLAVTGLATLASLTVTGTSIIGDQTGDAVTIKGTQVNAYSSGLLDNASAADWRTDLDVYDKAHVDGLLEAADALQFKGGIDASGEPDYPAANAGHLYVVSVAGKVGGASGIEVEIGDTLICRVDESGEGDQATVGANWTIIQFNIIGALTNASIGVAVQAHSDDLDAIAALDPAEGDLLRYESGAWVLATPADLWVTAPATASDPGVAGQKAYDAEYLYICVATDTWVRTPLTTWS